MNPPGSSRWPVFPHATSLLARLRSESHPLNIDPRHGIAAARRIYFILEVFWLARLGSLAERTLSGSASPDSSFGSLAYSRSPKEPRRLIKLGLRLFVCMRFQDLFHSPSGVLFAFPSRYWCTIGRSRVFSLGGWSPRLRTGLHVSRPTCRTLSSTSDFSRTGLSPTVAVLSRTFHYVES